MPPVELHRVGVDHLAAERVGQRERQRRLAGRGRPDDGHDPHAGTPRSPRSTRRRTARRRRAGRRATAPAAAPYRTRPGPATARGRRPAARRRAPGRGRQGGHVRVGEGRGDGVVVRLGARIVVPRRLLPPAGRPVPHHQQCPRILGRTVRAEPLHTPRSACARPARTSPTVTGRPIGIPAQQPRPDRQAQRQRRRGQRVRRAEGDVDRGPVPAQGSVLWRVIGGGDAVGPQHDDMPGAGVSKPVDGGVTGRHVARPTRARRRPPPRGRAAAGAGRQRRRPGAPHRNGIGRPRRSGIRSTVWSRSRIGARRGRGIDL